MPNTNEAGAWAGGGHLQGKRELTTLFINIGLEADPLCEMETFEDEVSEVYALILQVLEQHGAQMRQFIHDDKGIVCIAAIAACIDSCIAAIGTLPACIAAIAERGEPREVPLMLCSSSAIAL